MPIIMIYILGGLFIVGLILYAVGYGCRIISMHNAGFLLSALSAVIAAALLITLSVGLKDNKYIDDYKNERVVERTETESVPSGSDEYAWVLRGYVSGKDCYFYYTANESGNIAEHQLKVENCMIKKIDDDTVPRVEKIEYDSRINPDSKFAWLYGFVWFKKPDVYARTVNSYYVIYIPADSLVAERTPQKGN